MTMTVAETERLRLRELTPDDAAFILELVNDPDWLRFIGDRGVHDLDDARSYIAEGPVAMYAARGFGLYGAELKAEGRLAGLCGLIKRDGLDDVDIGFAFLAGDRGKGYAAEAAAATLDLGLNTLALGRVVAIVKPDNTASIKLLEKLGMVRERELTMPGETEPVAVFAIGCPDSVALSG